MRIQHNIMAMNAYRNYTNNTSALAKNLEKLSSGYRINRAGDDAAGLAISEKMRAQITALGTAQKNVKDGISLVKTAEGATQEVHDMLNRMVDLATQSANGTYQDEVDRDAIELEFNALKTEIDRIAEASNFNGIKLLDGSLAAGDAEKVAQAASGVKLTDVSDTLVFADADTIANGAVVGDDTILKLEGATEQSPEFTIDLGKITFEGDGTTATAPTFDVSIGGNDLTINTTDGTTAFDKDTQLTTEGMADAIVAAINKTASSVQAGANAADVYLGITIDGQVFKAEKVGTNQIKLTLSDQVKGGAAIAAGSEQVPKDSTAAALNTSLTINNATNGSVLKNGDTITGGNIVIKPGVAQGAGNVASTKVTLTADMITDGGKLTVGNKTYTFKVGADSKVKDGDDTIDLTDETAGSATILEKAIDRLTQKSNDNEWFSIGSNGGDNLVFTEKAGYEGEGDLTTLTGLKSNFKLEKAEALTDEEMKAAQKEAAKGLTLQIGEDSKSYNQLKVEIGDMHVAALGLDTLTLKTQKGAQDAVDVIKTAINNVSTIRSTLGATQNRLEHTANNLSTMKENIQDAEATIRDTDIAEEMMAYTKNNILVQSAQAMLAQANQIPQGVLQLLG